MSAKAKSVKGSLSAANYKEQEGKESTVVCQNHMYGETAEERWEEMREIASLNKRTEKPFIENIVSPPERYTKDFTVEDWKQLATDYCEKMGYNDNQWYAVVHENTEHPHLHISVNRIDFSGRNTIDDSFIGERSGKAMEAISRDRGWKTAHEVAQEKKNLMKEALLESVKESGSWEMLQDKMEDRGFRLELSTNEKGLNGARIIPLEELSDRRDREKSTASMIEGKKPLQRESFISTKQKKFTKPGYKLSEIDRKLKIKDIEQLLQANLQLIKKAISYGIGY